MPDNNDAKSTENTKDNGKPAADEAKKEQDSKKEVDNSLGEKIIEAARSQYVGKYTYVLGATGDDGHLDCGLFTQKCFADVGITLESRCADEQMVQCRDNGGAVFEDQSAVIAGDLVFYKGTYSCDNAIDNVTHVGICVNPDVQIDCGVNGGGPTPVERGYLNFDMLFGRVKELLEKVPLGANVKRIEGKAGASGSVSGYKGFRITPAGGDSVRITKLPDKKTPAEPIYPDYVTVSDTVPKWVLDKTTDNENAKNENADSSSSSNQAEIIKDGDAPETAPNGLHYSENDISYLQSQNKDMSRAQAIEALKSDKKYTRKLKKNDDGTFSPVEEEKKNNDAANQATTVESKNAASDKKPEQLPSGHASSQGDALKES